MDIWLTGPILPDRLPSREGGGGGRGEATRGGGTGGKRERGMGGSKQFILGGYRGAFLKKHFLTSFYMKKKTFYMYFIEACSIAYLAYSRMPIDLIRT